MCECLYAHIKRKTCHLKMVLFDKYCFSLYIYIYICVDADALRDVVPFSRVQQNRQVHMPCKFLLNNLKIYTQQHTHSNRFTS